MMVEDYVSFETAKLLKEKGFDEDIARVVNEEGEIDYLGSFQPSLAYLHHTWYRCPTLQLAMKWLREEKKLNCIIDVSFNQDRNGETEYCFYVWENKPPYELLREHTQTFSIYEEACEAAIKYCLENLI